MDHHPAVVPPTVPRTSTQKIEDVLEEMRTVSPDGEESARLQQLLGMVLPMVRRLGVIPDDPGELDEMLLKGAAVALRLRSDGAPMPTTLDELLEPAPAAGAEEVAS
jgi:hypothetical protein